MRVLNVGTFTVFQNPADKRHEVLRVYRLGVRQPARAQPQHREGQRLWQSLERGVEVVRVGQEAERHRQHLSGDDGRAEYLLTKDSFAVFLLGERLRRKV